MILPDGFKQHKVLIRRFLVWDLVHLEDFDDLGPFLTVIACDQLQVDMSLLVVGHKVLFIIIFDDTFDLCEDELLAISYLDEQVLDCVLEEGLIDPLFNFGSPDRDALHFFKRGTLNLWPELFHLVIVIPVIRHYGVLFFLLHSCIGFKIVVAFIDQVLSVFLDSFVFFVFVVSWIILFVIFVSVSISVLVVLVIELFVDFFLEPLARGTLCFLPLGRAPAATCAILAPRVGTEVSVVIVVLIVFIRELTITMIVFVVRVDSFELFRWTFAQLRAFLLRHGMKPFLPIRLGFGNFGPLWIIFDLLIVLLKLLLESKLDHLICLSEGSLSFFDFVFYVNFLFEAK